MLSELSLKKQKTATNRAGGGTRRSAAIDRIEDNMRNQMFRALFAIYKWDQVPKCALALRLVSKSFAAVPLTGCDTTAILRSEHLGDYPPTFESPKFPSPQLRSFMGFKNYRMERRCDDSNFKEHPERGYCQPILLRTDRMREFIKSIPGDTRRLELWQSETRSLNQEDGTNLSRLRCLRELRLMQFTKLTRSPRLPPTIEKLHLCRGLWNGGIMDCGPLANYQNLHTLILEDSRLCDFVRTEKLRNIRTLVDIDCRENLDSCNSAHELRFVPPPCVTKPITHRRTLEDCCVRSQLQQ